MPHIEGSVWKLKGSLTGSTWKKHWVDCDGVRLSQYHSRNKPAKSEQAKYVLNLADCTVEYTQERKFCFKVTDAASKSTLVLAVDDFDTYEQWLKILVKKDTSTVDEASALLEEEDAAADPDYSTASYEEKSAFEEIIPPKDKVLEFFRSHDRCADSSNPCVDMSRVAELVAQLDGTMNTAVIIRLLCRDFNIGTSSVLAHSDFVAWWESSAYMRSALTRTASKELPTQRIAPNTIIGINCPEAVHLVGFVDSAPVINKNAHRSAFLAHLRLPANDAILENLKTPELYEVADWNDVYQSSAEKVFALSSQLLPAPEQTDQGRDEEEQNEEQRSVLDQSVQGSHSPPREKYLNPQYDEDNQSVLSVARSEASQMQGSQAGASQVSGSVSRSGSVVPTHSASRNSLSYSASISRDHTALGRGSVATQSLAPSVVPGSVAYSRALSAAASVAHTAPPLPATSPPGSPQSSSRSVVSHAPSVATQSVAQSVAQMSVRSQQPPLPPSSYQSEDGRSERSETIGPSSPVRVVRSEQEQWQEVLQACVDMGGVKGAFYRTAIDGVRCIIDEYCLPDEMKSATKLSADLVDTEGFHAVSENANSTAVEVYAHSGMLFSIAACPASTADAPQSLHSVAFSLTAEQSTPGAEGRAVSPTELVASNGAPSSPQSAALQRLAQISASDEVQHKIAGNEVRNTALLQATIDILYAQGMLNQRILAATPPSNSPTSRAPASASFFGSSTLPDNASVADSYDSRMPPPLPPDSASVAGAYTPPTKPATLLTTVVDYAGFRVTVLCPTLIDEAATLVHGASSVPVPQAPGNGQTVHIRAAAEVPMILSSLSTQLNLSCYQRPRTVSFERICETETAKELPIRNVEILSSDLQVHDASDGRMYILNLKNILPNALPRPQSFDVQTRQLRAEYVQSFSEPLKADILQQTAAPPSDPSGTDIRTDRLVIQEAGMNIAACRDLFSTILPAVATTLDSLASVPMDSFGLTQFLHSCGVNMRHLGVLYWLCSAPSVKQLLLSEALARCCKSVLNSQLRAHARKIRGGVLRAQHRGRSIQHEYKEFVGNAMMSQKATVLELFNLTLGWGPQSDRFWDVTLLDALNQKFGISSSKAHLLGQLHLPQLLLAMQYHTGTRLQDTPVFNLNTTVVVSPFTTQNIEEYFIPAAKVALSIPGEVGQVCEMGDALLLNGLHREAACAFKLKHALQAAMFPEPDPLSTQKVKSPPPAQQFGMAHTAYKLALCQFLSGQLAASHRTMRKYLARCVRYHPVTARILTLLMCVEFKLGKPHKAAQYFDAAQEVYTYTLGANHPIICLHMNCMADLYQETSAFQQARVMKLLAHVTAQKSLGERHLLTASLEYRLAAGYVEVQEHLTAMPYLENCVDVYTAAVVEGGRFEYEASTCLYYLCMCMVTVGDVDRAGQLALKCVDVAQRVDWKKSNYYPMVVSCYFLLCDLALAKNQGAAAVGLLEQCWGALQRVPPSFAQRKWVGDAMGVLARRILSLLVASLPMTVRSLFDSVVSQYHRQQQDLNAPHSPLRARYNYDAMSPLSALDDDITVSTSADADYPQRAHAQAKLWEQTCDAVLRALLHSSPTRYFETTMQGIRESAVAGDDYDHDSAMSPSVLAGTQPRISFAAQAAVISKLVHQTADGSAHTFVHL